LDVENIRGQKYDGASNICREWNRMQSRFIEECP
jgi:hypothetical protein